MSAKYNKIILFFVLSIIAGYIYAQSPLSWRKDAVVIEGKKLSLLLGEKIRHIGVFIWRDGRFEPIPFQIDEKTKDGEYVFPNGSQRNPQEGNSRLDKQDELVFMVWDAGLSAPKDFKFPQGAKKGVEVVITDPVKNQNAYAYIFSFECSAPRSSKDYVKNLVEEGRNFVKTDYYWFGEPIGEGYFDRLHLISPSGKIGPNMVDRIKGRGFIRAFGGIIKIRSGEYNTPTDLVAWIDGPVRVIRRMIGGVELFKIKVKLSGGADNVFYRDWFYTPIFFTIPPGASSFLKGSYMLYTIDFNKNFLGSYYFDAVNPKPVILDGKMDEKEENLNRTSNHNWYAVGGDKGNLVERFIVPKEWGKYVNIVTFYIDDSEQKDPPEAEPGRHQVGFKISGMFEVPAGKYEYRLYYMVSDQKLDQNTIKPWLYILDQPLKIQIKSLSQ